MAYPQWSYFPRNAEPPCWVTNFVAVVASSEETISTVEKKTGLSSDEVLKQLSTGMAGMGFKVESGKAKDAKIVRPVLYGENGVPSVSYEIDAFHDELGVAVEIEAGRGAHNNADYRDILRTSLILNAYYLVLVMPIAYRSGTAALTPAYKRTLNQLDAIYASRRLQLPFAGVLLVGY
jgi:hypothetical protein